MIENFLKLEDINFNQKKGYFFNIFKVKNLKPQFFTDSFQLYKNNNKFYIKIQFNKNEVKL